MASSSSSAASSGASTTGLLGVAFVVLKLTGYVNWPWLWVLSPFWIPVALLLTVLIVLGFVALIDTFLSTR